MIERNEYQENEANLMNYIKVMIRRKLTIIIVFLVCITIAVVYNLKTPEIYRVQETIRIGRIGNLLMSIDEAISYIKSKKILQPVVDELGQGLEISALSNSIEIEDIKNTDFLKLSLNHANPQKAMEILNAIADRFNETGNLVYSKKLELLRQHVNSLERRQQSIQKAMDNLESIIKGAQTKDFPLIQNTLTNYEQIYSGLTEKIYSLRTQLFSAKGFELFESPLKPDKPIKFANKQNIIIAGLLGLFLGIFIAFFREFWVNSSNKDEHR